MREVKRQIVSKQSTRQITKAMEMVASSKLRRAQEAAVSARPYTDTIRDVVASIGASSHGDIQHPMLQQRPIKRTAYLLITSDRGLAGGFNVYVLRKLTEAIKDNHKSPDEYDIFVIGRKGYDHCKHLKMHIAGEALGISDTPKFIDIKDVATQAVEGFEHGEYDQLFLIYNEFKNAMTQIPVMKQLLPLTLELEVGTSKRSASAQYQYEPSAEAVLNVLLPRYAETMIFHALLESKASEFGARMTAMGSATKNATTMIDELTLQYNRARQAAITQEITEIVGGANALE
jgi:F-type H+-transporting ATPase subunit gamma